MATGSGKLRCATCGKEKATTKCGGCSQDFCFNHLEIHRQELNKQLDEIEMNHDICRQSLNELTNTSQNQLIIQEIDQWERDSIDSIRRTADEARKLVLKFSTQRVYEIEIRLNKLTDQLRQGRAENDYIENDLNQWNEELNQLTNETLKPLDIKLRQDSQPLVNRIYVETSNVSSNTIQIDRAAKWKANGVTVAGGNGDGNGLNQLSTPWGINIDDEQTIYIADQGNHRIVAWKHNARNGEVVAGGNGKGNQHNQLNGPRDVIIDKRTDSIIISDLGNRRVMRWPRQNGTTGEIIIHNVDCLGLAMDDDGCVYVSDYKQNEVRRWRIGDNRGVLVAGGNGVGNRCDQLNQPTNIFVDKDNSVYVSDWNNNRVMKWAKDAKEGSVVAGGQGSGNSLMHLSRPYGIIVDQSGSVYVADWNNQRVVRWSKRATQGTIIFEGNTTENQINQTCRPKGLAFDRQGNLYIANESNNRIQRFDIE